MQLSSVTLAVRDLGRSIAFYTQAIGLESLDAAAGTARLGRGDQSLLHLVERRHGRPRGDAAGLFHVAWLVASRAHLGAALARLDQSGVRLTGAADHHVSEAIYLDDPDGNGIEVYADRPGTDWYRNGELVAGNAPLDSAGILASTAAAGLRPERSAEGLRLGHVHLEAVDLAASASFAEEALGLELRLAWPNARFLAWDGYHHHLAYNDWRQRRTVLEPDHDRLGLVGIELLGPLPDRLVDPNGIVFTRAARATAQQP
ncbi:MAG: VOC family protein [Geminicoccaceae bacterium]